MFVLGNAHAQHLKRLDDIDGERADARIHTLHVKEARDMEIVLHTVDDDAEGAVHDVEMRIDAERRRKEHIAATRITVEEEAVVEIAVRARKGDRFRRLVNGIIVCLGEHVAGLPCTPRLCRWLFMFSLRQEWRCGRAGSTPGGPVRSA